MGMADLVCVATAGIVSSSLMAVCFFARWIKGTPPGELFRVTCRWTKGVILTARFAVELRDFMMAGTLVMHGRVIIGVLLITLCCSVLTLCSTLCSIAVAGRGGGGVNILPM